MATHDSKIGVQTVTMDSRIEDASTAQLAARRHLELHYMDRLSGVKFRKIWFHTGKSRDVWEVEGVITLKKYLIGKEQRPFRFQIDPESGDVIGFEN